MLDFVKPLWPGRDLGCISRQAELKPAHAHVAHLGEGDLLGVDLAGQIYSDKPRLNDISRNSHALMV
jgi:hypothetical protein